MITLLLIVAAALAQDDAQPPASRDRTMYAVALGGGGGTRITGGGGPAYHFDATARMHPAIAASLRVERMALNYFDDSASMAALGVQWTPLNNGLHGPYLAAGFGVGGRAWKTRPGGSLPEWNDSMALRGRTPLLVAGSALGWRYIVHPGFWIDTRVGVERQMPTTVHPPQAAATFPTLSASVGWAIHTSPPTMPTKDQNQRRDKAVLTATGGILIVAGAVVVTGLVVWVAQGTPIG